MFVKSQHSRFKVMPAYKELSKYEELRVTEIVEQFLTFTLIYLILIVKVKL